MKSDKMDLTTRIWLHKLKNEGGGGPTPTGTIDITQNGTYNVSSYASADVDVPQPSGSISITTNGEVDVTNYETANVNVQAPSEYNMKIKNAIAGNADSIRYSIEKVPNFQLTGTSVNGLFNSYVSLLELPMMDTSGITDFQRILYVCHIVDRSTCI